MKVKLVGELNQIELKQLEEIYFLTSSSNQEEIKYKYFDYYIENSPALFFVAVDKEVLGYVCGLESTLDHYEQLDMHSYLDYYREELQTYPAHLHINVHPDTQGRGVGKLLMEHFENNLKSRGVRGLHIITVNGDENNKFYDRNGFSFTKRQIFQEKELLLMGKLL